MQIFLLQEEGADSVIMLIFIISIIKLSIFNLFKNKYWNFSHLLFFSFSNIRQTRRNSRIIIKVINNLLTFSILFIVLTYFIFFINYHKENKSGENLISPETKNAGIFKTNKKEYIDINYTSPQSPLSNINKNDENINKAEKSPKREKSSFKTIKSIKGNISKNRNFTLNDMYLILNQLNNKRQETGITSNHVQVIKTKDSNILNAFTLAEFLKKQGFVIAGRELRDVSIKGVRIDVEELVFKIYIGIY